MPFPSEGDRRQDAVLFFLGKRVGEMKGAFVENSVSPQTPIDKMIWACFGRLVEVVPGRYTNVTPITNADIV